MTLTLLTTSILYSIELLFVRAFGLIALIHTSKIHRLKLQNLPFRNPWSCFKLRTTRLKDWMSEIASLNQATQWSTEEVCQANLLNAIIQQIRLLM